VRSWRCVLRRIPRRDRSGPAVVGARGTRPRRPIGTTRSWRDRLQDLALLSVGRGHDPGPAAGGGGRRWDRTVPAQAVRVRPPPRTRAARRHRAIHADDPWPPPGSLGPSLVRDERDWGVTPDDTAGGRPAPPPEVQPAPDRLGVALHGHSRRLVDVANADHPLTLVLNARRRASQRPLAERCPAGELEALAAEVRSTSGSGVCHRRHPPPEAVSARVDMDTDEMYHDVHKVTSVIHDKDG
jgi:hypothetical protein